MILIVSLTFFYCSVFQFAKNEKDSKELCIAVLTDTIFGSDPQMLLRYTNIGEHPYYLPVYYFNTLQYIDFNSPEIHQNYPRPNFVLDEVIKSQNPELNCLRFDKSYYVFLKPGESVELGYSLIDQHYDGFESVNYVKGNIFIDIPNNFLQICDSILTGTFAAKFDTIKIIH